MSQWNVLQLLPIAMWMIRSSPGKRWSVPKKVNCAFDPVVEDAILGSNPTIPTDS